jgi:hypothetical protein
MDFPIVTKAEEPFKKLFPNKKYNQEVLMSAEYVVDGHTYRVVGIVKKSLFGGINDYNFIDFVVADLKGKPIEDEPLTRQVYLCYSTLGVLYQAKNHIKGSVLANPAYYTRVISRYEDIWNSAKPEIAKLRFPEEWYRERFDGFYQYVVQGNEKNIEADSLARELMPALDKAKSLKKMDLHEISLVKQNLNRFIQLTNERTLMVLRNKAFCTTVNSVLDFSRTVKDVQFNSLKEEYDLIRDILTGSKNAIKQSMIDAAIQQKIKTEEALVESIEATRRRGSMVDDLHEKGFKTKWLFRNSLRV